MHMHLPAFATIFLWRTAYLRSSGGYRPTNMHIFALYLDSTPEKGAMRRASALRQTEFKRARAVPKLPTPRQTPVPR